MQESLFERIDSLFCIYALKINVFGVSLFLYYMGRVYLNEGLSFGYVLEKIFLILDFLLKKVVFNYFFVTLWR